MKKKPSPFNPMEDIREFHQKFNLVYDGKPRGLPPELQSFRSLFLKEELREYHLQVTHLGMTLAEQPDDAAGITYHLEGMVDGLVDLVYVAMGTAYLHGFDFEESWRRVHEANMKKVRASSAEDSKRNSDQDVVKPQGWEPPSHSDLVEDNAHRLPPSDT